MMQGAFNDWCLLEVVVALVVERLLAIQQYSKKALLIGPVKTFHQKSRAPRASKSLAKRTQTLGIVIFGCLGAVGALDGSFRLLFRIQTPMPQGVAHATSGGTFFEVQV